MDHSDHNHNHGHHDHHKMMIEDFKRRFWISFLLSIPVLAFSSMIQGFLGVEFSFLGITYVSAVLSSFIFFYGGWPFLKGLKEELSEGGPGMMTLIAIAITVAWAYSSAVVLGLEGKVFYWELVTLIDIMLLGHWLEMRYISGVRHQLPSRLHARLASKCFMLVLFQRHCTPTAHFQPPLLRAAPFRVCHVACFGCRLPHGGSHCAPSTLITLRSYGRLLSIAVAG